MGKLVVVVGGQYGSEGKGMIAAHLSATEKAPLLAVRVAGPNAGHTVWNAGKQFKLQSLPVASVVSPASLAIAAGSEIDVAQLRSELELTKDYNTSSRLIVDSEATVIDPVRDQGWHDSAEKWGGTGKGVNRARAARMTRDAELALGNDELRQMAKIGDVAQTIREWLKDDGTVMVEGTQGFGLGTHAGSYPHCTGSDCRAIDFLSMAGVSPWAKEVTSLEVWVVLRTLPIRVAGNSGPMLGETSWEALAHQSHGYITPEQTTVTKKTRRIGSWDQELAERAIEANGGNERVNLALTFFDYLHPEVAGTTDFHVGASAAWTLREFEESLGKIQLLGTGPETVVDLRVGK